jgi:hypothetical protein
MPGRFGWRSSFPGRSSSPALGRRRVFVVGRTTSPVVGRATTPAVGNRRAFVVGRTTSPPFARGSSFGLGGWSLFQLGRRRGSVDDRSPSAPALGLHAPRRRLANARRVRGHPRAFAHERGAGRSQLALQSGTLLVAELFDQLLANHGAAHPGVLEQLVTVAVGASNDGQQLFELARHRAAPGQPHPPIGRLVADHLVQIGSNSLEVFRT